jgi:hypothetical protein
MLLVQKYLETKSFAQLAIDHGVYASFSKSGHKFSLNYDQLEAKESDSLAQECRGLILARVNGTSMLSEAKSSEGRLRYDHITPGKTKIIAFPMKRFFNHGQGSASNINWNNFKVLEKLDGTLSIVYFDTITSKWCVATRSVPDADITIDAGNYTFRTLFEKAVNDTLKISFDEFSNSMNKYYTYCFELTTPYNRIVVQYPTSRITLLAVRDNTSLNELCINTLSDIFIDTPTVRSFNLNTIEDIVHWVSIQNPTEYEGVVVRDNVFNRIKIKNAAYIAFSKARDVLGSSDRNCLELILAEKEDDVIPMLPPEIVDNLLKIKFKVIAMIHSYDELFKQSKQEADFYNPQSDKQYKKTFAQIVTIKHGVWTAPLFQLLDNKASNMREFIANNKRDGGWSSSFLDKILDVSSKY